MNKDKLYKVNKYNRQGLLTKKNLFAFGTPDPIYTQTSGNNSPSYGIGRMASQYNSAGIAGDGFYDFKNVGGYFAGGGGSSMPSGGGEGSGGGGLSVIQAAPGIGRGIQAAFQDKPQYSEDAHNGFSTVDTTLTGGKKSKIGTALVNGGASYMNSALSSGDFKGALYAGIAGTVGTIINNAAGVKVDEDRMASNQEGQRYFSNYKANAASLDEVPELQAMATFKNPLTGGVFNDQTIENAKLREQYQDAKSFAQRYQLGNMHNIMQDNMNNQLRYFSAFGGPLDKKKYALGGSMFGLNGGVVGLLGDVATANEEDNSFPYSGILDTANTGALTYNFLTKPNKEPQSTKMTNMFAGTPNSMFAIGGDLQTGGSDWSTGLTHVDAGSSHELNPNDGVQMGVDSEGTPNLVEEGEVVYNDYVYSNRIPVDMTTKEKFRLPKKKEITYADLAKKLEKEISERPNDPISQAGFKAQMEQLEEQQERQKQEMEAERAKAAFEALSPEEQTALMQQKAEQEAMAQQAIQQEAMAAQQQPTPEELAMAQQAQMQADGSQAMVGQQPIMAEGGHLYAGGSKLRKGIYDALGFHTDKEFLEWARKHKLRGDDKWEASDDMLKALAEDDDAWRALIADSTFAEAIKDNPALADAISKGYDFGAYTPDAMGNVTFKDINKGNWTAQDYEGWKDSQDPAWLEAVKKGLVKEGMKQEDIAKALKQTDNYKKGSKWLQDSEDNRLRYLRTILENDNSPEVAKNYARKFIDENGWKKGAARDYESIFGANGKGVRETHPGTYWHTPIEAVRGAQAKNWVINDDGKIEEIFGDVPTDWTAAGNYAWATPENDIAYNYYRRPATIVDLEQKAEVKPGEKKVEDERNVVPVHKDERLRYAGLFGPAVGLGMQALGVGKPDTSGIDAAIAAANQPAHLADVKYIGDYMRYNPLDRQYYINQLEANSRATDRALLNSNSPSRAAGLLANGYNTTLGLGNLARQAEEYNRTQYEKTKEFNRGTNIFNAQAYNQNQQFNAEAQNRARQYAASLGLQGAVQKLDANAGWYNGIYGNVAGLFKGIGDLGKENATRNTVADMAASGIYGTINPDNFNPNGMLRWETDKERAKRKRACGGRLKKGKRGLTF